MRSIFSRRDCIKEMMREAEMGHGRVIECGVGSNDGDSRTRYMIL